MNLNTTVTVSELRKKLSHYLRKVKRGSSICVTLRGQTVAILMPVGNHPGTHIAKRLSRMGVGSWTGGKPKSGSRRITVKGTPVSEIVIEERR